MLQQEESMEAQLYSVYAVELEMAVKGEGLMNTLNLQVDLQHSLFQRYLSMTL